MPDSSELVRRLLSGSDDVQLNGAEFAQLTAYLKNDRPTLQELADGEQTQLGRDRAKLKRILDFNRELRATRSEASQTAAITDDLELWKKSLARIQSRFGELSKTPFPCVLIDEPVESNRIPLHDVPSVYVRQGYEPIQGQKLCATQPRRRRECTIYARRIDETMESFGLILDDANSFLRAASEIWQRWAGCDLSDDENARVWVSIAFEIAWQRIPGQPLAATKSVSFGEGTSQELAQFLEAKDLVGDSVVRRRFPELANNDPPYFSTLDNLAEASFQACEILLSMSPEEAGKVLCRVCRAELTTEERARGKCQNCIPQSGLTKLELQLICWERYGERHHDRPSDDPFSGWEMILDQLVAQFGKGVVSPGAIGSELDAKQIATRSIPRRSFYPIANHAMGLSRMSGGLPTYHGHTTRNRTKPPP